MKPQISLVIPTRNEAGGIEEVIRGACPYVGEIVVVDGRSDDGTIELARACGAICVSDDGRGKGAAMRLGLQVASGEVVVFMDADGSHDPVDIPRLVAPILDDRQADLVLGSRHKGGSDEWEGDLSTYLRAVGCGFLTLCINYRWNVRITDCLNGFKAVRAAVAKDLRLTADDFDIEQQVVTRALRLGYRVLEVPTHEYSRRWGVSKLPTYRKAYLFFWRLFLDLLPLPGERRARLERAASIASGRVPAPQNAETHRAVGS